MRMHPYAILIIVFIALIAVLASGSSAIPACTFRDTSCSGGETCMFKVFQENNTHVGSCDSNYPISVCCTEVTAATIRTPSCNADEGGVMSFYATSNSHAGRKDYYSSVLCTKTSSNPIVANVRSSCLDREGCLAAVFQQNDTHVGKCGYYGNSLCIQQLFNTTVTMILNNTSPGWKQIVNLQGVASRSDGSSVDTSADPEDVRVYLNATTLLCVTDTNSTGGYVCSFSAPSAIGLYELNVTIGDPTTGKSLSNSTTFTVKQFIGAEKKTEEAAESIACYEEPRIVQNPDGTIKVAIVRICVFK